MLTKAYLFRNSFRKLKILLLSGLLVVSFFVPNFTSLEVSAETTVPILVTPFDGWVFTTYYSFLFDWEPSSDASGFAIDYEIEVSTEPNFFTSEFVETTGMYSEFYYPISYLLDDGIYYWRVRGDGFMEPWSDWSDTWNFTIATKPPLPPVLLTPDNDQFVNTNMPEFNWEVSQRDTSLYHGQYPGSYNIQVSNSSDYSYLLIDTEIVDNNYTSEIILDDGNYWWRVRPRGTLGTLGLWSSSWNFTIDTSNPISPNLVSPINSLFTDEVDTVLVWDSLEDVKEYHVQVSNSYLFSQTFYNITTSANNFTIPVALTDGSYWWRVRAVDYASNIGSWSSFWSFTVDTSPPVISDITLAPLNPEKPSEVTLYCHVSDPSGIYRVVISYIFEGGNWTEKDADKFVGGTYVVTIGTFTTNGTVDYFFSAIDELGHVASSRLYQFEFTWLDDETESPISFTSVLISFVFSAMILALTKKQRKRKNLSKEID